MTDLALVGVAYAEANWGRWIARCVRPWCTNAIALLPGQVEFRCNGADSCGLDAVIVWPADPEAIEVVLAMRPVRRTQNWLPGETIERLLAENAEHDCLPPEWSELAAAAPEKRALLVTTMEQRVTGGLLQQEIEAAALRREIGGQ